jgi:hypothetical protein
MPQRTTSSLRKPGARLGVSRFFEAARRCDADQEDFWRGGTL